MLKTTANRLTVTSQQHLSNHTQLNPYFKSFLYFRVAFTWSYFAFIYCSSIALLNTCICFIYFSVALLDCSFEKAFKGDILLK